MAQPSDQQPPSVALHLDVTDLAASCAFYERALGFRVVRTIRDAAIFPTRELRSARLPAVALVLREGFGKRVGGTQPGGITRVCVAVPGLGGMIGGLKDAVRWVGDPPAEGSAGPVRFIDPDAYEFELFDPTG
ncbi:MAG: VOC family protein [Phycisphaeraceae bacterium]|nr:VOC family protein [Phycisphaeraceae bacterium]